MNATSLGKWVILCAVAAVPLGLSGRAAAQVPVQDGTAHDANPRLGSGGYNDRRDIYQSTQVTGNQIVTGNVTLGREFRGTVNYTDPLQFRGNLGSTSFDDFIKNSNGVPGPNQGHVIPGQVQAFYGNALVGPPPAGFVEKGFTGTFTPPPPPPPTLGQRNAVEAQLAAPSASLMPPAGDYLISGPQPGQPNMLVSPSVSGLPGLNTAGLTPYAPTYTGYSAVQWETPIERMRYNPQSILQMREELMRSINNRSPFAPEQPAPLTPQSLNPNLARPMLTPFEAPQSVNLTQKPLESGVSAQPLENTLRPESAIANRLTNPLPTASQQSTQYAELQKRLERYYADRLKTDEQRQREFLRQLNEKEAAEKAATAAKAPEPGAVTPAPLETGPDYAKMSQELLNAARNPKGAQPGIVKPQPVQVHSLAAGAKGPLGGLLQKAEDEMKAGKYVSAVEQYDLAARVVPNNSLVVLGRANAELGAGYYRKAETDLRLAMGGDPTLMMGQYDLKSMIGQQRLEEVVKDLKEVALKQPNDPGPVLLLAYVAYNTGNEKSAGMYLDQAEKRSGGKDVFYRLLKMHWQVPGENAAGAATQPAK